MKRNKSLYPHLGAFESTKLSDSGTDILGTTRHIERWRHDLELLRSSGLTSLRYSVPWHRIEKNPGEFDFTWMDGPMSCMRRHGMRPILDPLHHISHPDWLTGGFSSPFLAELYERFVLAVAERYDWATEYTVFNEPLPTTILCGYRGVWYPYGDSDAAFVRMAMNVARTICRVSAVLRKHNPEIRLVHVDTCEVHRALDRQSQEWVDHANERRYMMHDMILGRITPSHPMYQYLSANGFMDDDMHWLADHPAQFDVLGLDYYMHCEMEWYHVSELNRPNISWPSLNPVGFAAVGREYADRFRVPIMLSETNIRGSFEERLSWLKFMEEQCEELAAERDFRGFCWYPSIDSTDWCHACTKATGIVDPQGIWGLSSDRWDRVPSELSKWYARVALGEARAADLPSWVFGSRLHHDVRGFCRLMKGWEWLDVTPIGRAA